MNVRYLRISIVSSVYILSHPSNRSLLVKSSIFEDRNPSGIMYITDFDPTKPLPYIWERNMPLNKYGASLLEMLNWPQETLLLFGTKEKAIICLKTLFPGLVNIEKMRIRAQVLPLPDIDWNFQSSLEKFRNFPSWPLEYFITQKSPIFARKYEIKPKTMKRNIKLVEYDSDSEEDEAKRKKTT